MTMSGYEFSQGWFQDVQKLMVDTDLHYDRLVAIHGPAGSKLALTRNRIIKERRWQPSLPLIAKSFDQVLTELNAFYVPGSMDPGPAIVFPQRDVFGNYRRARVKPVGWDLIIGGGVSRYAGIGLKQEFIGPAWIGNSRLMVQRILEHRSVLIVEGPFDLLAVRLLLPDIPALSAGTDYLGWKHLDYLRILGVKTVYLMFDQDVPNSKGKSPGIEAMRSTQRKLDRDKITDMRAIPVVCPRKDPSLALEDYRSAVELRNQLKPLFRTAATACAYPNGNLSLNDGEV